MLDLHRIRHIIQPEVNFYTSATTLDREDVFDYDPNIDAINNITAVQVALHQHWETMRGGPGKWESQDIFDLNVEGNFFYRQPQADFLDPTQFRSLFFPSDPEFSVPRQGVNGDASWHVSDTTAVFSDAYWNMDDQELAIIQGGLAVSRADRLSYYIDDSYVQTLRSQVIGVAAEYRLSPKYTLQAVQSFDIGDSQDTNTGLVIIREFDTIVASFEFFHDAITNDTGFEFNLIPTVAGGALGHPGVLNSLGGGMGTFSQ